jgi:hypothetical protein
MRRFLFGLLTAAVLLGLCALPARACINDREVHNAEREFKSHYVDPTPSESVSPAEPVASTRNPLKFYGPLTLGGLLLVGAFVQTLIPRRRV